MKKQVVLLIAFSVFFFSSFAQATPSAIYKKAASEYILGAMLRWVPLLNQTVHGETEDEARARYQATADNIVDIVLDENEPTVFRGGDDGRLKSALEIASIASFEGGFQKFVDDGTCNQKDYKADGRGGCDGHTAFTVWQIHIFGNGYIIQGDDITTKMYAPQYAAEHPDEVLTGKSLIEDRRTAVRVALRLIRKTYQDNHSLCGYTGEPCCDTHINQETLKEVSCHPKADLRHDRAKNYFRQHPFTAPAEVDTLNPNPSVD